MKKFIKRNIKIILGFALGLIWSSGIAYAATILFDSDEVSYDNTTSGLSATNVQSALDELYVESTSYQLFETRVSSIENKLYPVGSYYETSDSSFNPNTSFGGTWVSGSGKRVIQDDLWTGDIIVFNGGTANCSKNPLNYDYFMLYFDDTLNSNRIGTTFIMPVDIHSATIDYRAYFSAAQISYLPVSSINSSSIVFAAGGSWSGSGWTPHIKKIVGIRYVDTYLWERTA